MKVAMLFESVRPLRWENEDADFEYSIGGSGFLVRFHGRHFLITARHCLIDRDINSIRVEIRNNSRVFNAVKYLHKIEGEERWHDLAFFEFDPKLDLNNDLLSSEFLDFDHFSQLPRDLSADAVFAFRGYPTELNAPDYEKKILKCTSVTMDGKWNGDWIKPNCGALKLTGSILDFGIEDLDGVSGSPVFEFRQVPGGIYGKFAGVVFWGCGHVLRFIDAKVVFFALDRICRESPPRSFPSL